QSSRRTRLDHSDHNADYGNLILLAWAAGLRTRLDSWGPPPLVRMTDLFFEMNATDIRGRTVDERRSAARKHFSGRVIVGKDLMEL
ncbi:MAG: hypothetical protein ACREOJ_06320, partial [Gemmatimonadaceae bacterium]